MKLINKTKINIKLYIWDIPIREEPFATLILKVDEEREIPDAIVIKIEEN